MRALIIILALCFAAAAYAQIAVPLGSNPNVNQTVPVFPNVASMVATGAAAVVTPGCSGTGLKFNVACNSQYIGLL